MTRAATVKKPDSPKVVHLRKPRKKRWWNKKVKLWQAMLMSLGSVWIFWVFWVIGYIEGQIR